MKAVALADVADVNPRVTSRPSGDDPVAFVPMAELDAVSATTSLGETRSFSEVSKGYTLFKDGDLLVAKITPCFENNKIGQARLSHPVGVGSSEFHVVRPNRERLDDRYLLHFLRRDYVRVDGQRRMTGSGGQRRVPPDFLRELRVPLPPLDEQRRIAAILDQADALRAKRREAIARVDDLPQSIFHHMFSRSDWPEEPLAEVVDDGTLVTYGIVQAGEEFAGGVPYIRTGDIVDGRIVSASLRRTDPAIAAKFERSRVRAGDIVMSIRATVGTTAVVPREIDGANLTQGTARIAPSRRTLGPYLLAYLRSETAQRWIQAQVKGATFREITLGRLRQLAVPVPPIQLQQDFARRVDQVEAGREVSVRALHASEELCASLQSRAFRGEL